MKEIIELFYLKSSPDISNCPLNCVEAFSLLPYLVPYWLVSTDALILSDYEASRHSLKVLQKSNFDDVGEFPNILNQPLGL